MEEVQISLEFLRGKIEKEEKIQLWSLEEYLQKVAQNPQKFLRDIFALFHDMVMHYVGEGKSEYPMDDPTNAPLIVYDCSKLFEEDLNHPYFVDRFFANRLVEEVRSLARGAQQNRILAFIGPPGCGKSTFLNNLLEKLEQYLNKGETFEVLWEIDPAEFFCTEGRGSLEVAREGEKFEVPCPSHDYPLLVLPKQYRLEFLELLLQNSPEKSQIFDRKEYQWVFHQQACSICDSLFWAIYERAENIEKVLKMIKVRPYRFDRRLGEGVVVFNPGDLDPLSPGRPYFTNQTIQENLDKVFGPNRVRYMYSVLAKSNNGIYTLMDIKGQNAERFKALHNVVSEGVWRAGEIEEGINSLFLALMNLEDKDVLEKEEAMKSLQGRIRYIDIPYPLDPKVVVKIYESIFGKGIQSHFLPRVLENFAKVIVATRMKEKCEPLARWIGNIGKYAPKYCDKEGRLLRMDIYSGQFPLWLLDEDRRKLDLPLKRELLLFPIKEREGMEGFDGRISIQLFENFFSLYQTEWRLIRMDNVADYFKEKIDPRLKSKIPAGFIDALLNSYDYEAVSELEEALYFYDEKQVAQDVLHFIWASSHKIGEKVTCPWTKKELEVTQGFLRETAIRLTGKSYLTDAELQQYILDIQKKLSVATMQGEAQEITKSELYKYLLQNYIKNLKEKILEPFVDNPTFLAAIQAYGTKDFEAFESRMKDHIERMIRKLMEKFGYTTNGAKELATYVLEKKIPKKFS